MAEPTDGFGPVLNKIQADISQIKNRLDRMETALLAEIGRSNDRIGGMGQIMIQLAGIMETLTARVQALENKTK